LKIDSFLQLLWIAFVSLSSDNNDDWWVFLGCYEGSWERLWICLLTTCFV